MVRPKVHWTCEWGQLCVTLITEEMPKTHCQCCVLVGHPESKEPEEYWKMSFRLEGPPREVHIGGRKGILGTIK